jgi:hypothetical protein
MIANDRVAEQWSIALRELGEELRETFAEERRAIGALDHKRLSYLAVHKQHLAERLAEARATAPLGQAPILRELFAALRIEAHANAMLATVATEAVRTILGYESTGGYDRAARRTTTQPMQMLRATY